MTGTGKIPAPWNLHSWREEGVEGGRGKEKYITINKLKRSQISVNTTQTIAKGGHAMDGDGWEWRSYYFGLGNLRKLLCESNIWSERWINTKDPAKERPGGKALQMEGIPRAKVLRNRSSRWLEVKSENSWGGKYLLRKTSQLWEEYKSTSSGGWKVRMDEGYKQGQSSRD